MAVGLEWTSSRPALEAARVEVRTVEGEVVWTGPATTGSELPSHLIARADVPAERLPVNDYVVVLYGTDAAGREQEHDGADLTGAGTIVYSGRIVIESNKGKK